MTYKLDIWDILKVMGMGLAIVAVAYMLLSGQPVCLNPVMIG